jgi:hypothetical protein
METLESQKAVMILGLLCDGYHPGAEARIKDQLILHYSLAELMKTSS